MSELIKRIVAATGVRDWQAYQMLEAIREPSVSGIAAAQDASYVGPSGAIEVWQGMIDAALKEARDTRP